MFNKPYYSIQEMVDKTEVQRRQIELDMDTKGFFDPAETASILRGQKGLVRYRLAESLRAIPLQEFLMKSDTGGVAGADYLVPDKLHDDLIFYAGETDMCPLISAQMVNGWDGGDLKVDVVNDETYIANPLISGSIAPSETAETKQPTVTPKTFGINVPIGGDLVEDNPHGLVEWHVRQAAKPIGKLATDYALAVLASGTDGWGTLNASVTGDTNETKWIGGATADITDAITAIADDEWIANTIVMMPHVWYHSVRETIGVLTNNASDWWKSTPMPVYAGPAPNFDFRMENLDVKLSTSPVLHGGYVRGVTDAPAAPPTLCVTLIFDRNNALLTGRKRWMRIENYSNPTRIIEGAVVSCRQDSVTLYNDAIYKLTEGGQQ